MATLTHLNMTKLLYGFVRNTSVEGMIVPVLEIKGVPCSRSFIVNMAKRLLQLESVASDVCNY